MVAKNVFPVLAGRAGNSRTVKRAARPKSRIRLFAVADGGDVIDIGLGDKRVSLFVGNSVIADGATH